MAIKRIICFAITELVTTSDVLRSVLLMTLLTFFEDKFCFTWKLIIPFGPFLILLCCDAFVVIRCSYLLSRKHAIRILSSCKSVKITKTAFPKPETTGPIKNTSFGKTYSCDYHSETIQTLLEKTYTSRARYIKCSMYWRDLEKFCRKDYLRHDFTVCHLSLRIH